MEIIILYENKMKKFNTENDIELYELKKFLVTVLSKTQMQRTEIYKIFRNIHSKKIENVYKKIKKVFPNETINIDIEKTGGIKNEKSIIRNRNNINICNLRSRKYIYSISFTNCICNLLILWQGIQQGNLGVGEKNENIRKDISQQQQS